ATRARPVTPVSAPLASAPGGSDSFAETKPRLDKAEVASAQASGPNPTAVDGPAQTAKEPGVASSGVGAAAPIAAASETGVGPQGKTEQVFGPYDIIGEIARGGMGIVYRARQRDLKRIVALKVMKEGETATEKQIRRFKRETEAAARLQHPNIVAVHEVGCHL